jgi:hypothetical protein
MNDDDGGDDHHHHPSPAGLDRLGSASSDCLFKDFQFVFILLVSNSALFLALGCKKQ